MSSFELNKLVGAFLATGVLVMVLNIAADAVFTTHQKEKIPAFLVESALVVENTAPVRSNEAESLLTLLLAADQNAGKKTTKKCLP